MINRTFGIVAICAVTTQALLLPPGSSNNDLLNSVVDPKSRSIQVPCTSCAYPLSRADGTDDVDNDEQLWTQAAHYEVNLSFGVSQNGQRLELNGSTIYPPQSHDPSDLRRPPVYVDSVSSSGRVTSLEVTSSGLTIDSEQPVSDDGDAMVMLKFSVMALESTQIPAFPDIAINLLKVSNGELFIVTINNHLDSHPLPIPSPSDRSGFAKECDYLPSALCQLKKKLLATIESARNGELTPSMPCPHYLPWSGRLPTHIRPHIEVNVDDASHDHHDHSVHASLEKVSHRHRRMHRLAKSVIAILIPITAGITVGLLVSFLGLLIGRVIGCLWIRFVRGGRRGRASLVMEEARFEDEKIATFYEELEVLPAYEDAPRYEDVATEPR